VVAAFGNGFANNANFLSPAIIGSNDKVIKTCLLHVFSPNREGNFCAFFAARTREKTGSERIDSREHFSFHGDVNETTATLFTLNGSSECGMKM
jgi:hypothetical protein